LRAGLHPEVAKAAATGKKGDELRAVIAKANASIKEDGPDHQPHLIAAGYSPEMIEAHLVNAGHPRELATKLAARGGNA
jgi:hypothetical protein